MRASVARTSACSASWRSRPGARVASPHACDAEFAEEKDVSDAKTFDGRSHFTFYVLINLALDLFFRSTFGSFERRVFSRRARL